MLASQAVVKVDDARVQETLRRVDQTISRGPYRPGWEHWPDIDVPEWYEDGKFGIFIHWGVYSVPAYGSEWYPREMYRKGSDTFKHHVETYGYQTTFGYKDFIPKLTAAQFDPTVWARLFVAAGAKFVVPVAEHHDGFAMYDSSITRWDAKQMGPHRDVIGELATAVRKEGLVFGLSSHRAEHWFFFNGGREFPSDVQDPSLQDFYGPAQPESVAPSKAFLDDWLARICELVDKYRPSLVWFDWWIQEPAFKPYLERFASYYYDRAKANHQSVAINYKYGAFPPYAAVLDIERGQLSETRPRFWQTDTSISKNSWGYVQAQDYKSATSLVQDLVDIVSKNGALLLNIGPKPDGTIPDAERKLLLQIGKWLKVNGEAIYGTRPWKVFGEGPTSVSGGAFTDTKRPDFTGADIRFTQKHRVLYATLLSWPGDRAVVRALPLDQGEVRSVSLLGHKGRLHFTQDTTGLTVEMPSQRPCDHAFVLKIEGLDPYVPELGWLSGSLRLSGDGARLHGNKISYESRIGQDTVGFWDDPRDWASWSLSIPRSGRYRIVGSFAAAKGGSAVRVSVAGKLMEAAVPQTKDWDDFHTVVLGEVALSRASAAQLEVRAAFPETWNPVNLAWVKLELLPGR